VVTQRFGVGVMVRVSLSRVVVGGRQAGRTWSAGEGAGRCLGRSAGRRT
jgi:hypothetical protein